MHPRLDGVSSRSLPGGGLGLGSRWCAASSVQFYRTLAWRPLDVAAHTSSDQSELAGNLLAQETGCSKTGLLPRLGVGAETLGRVVGWWNRHGGRPCNVIGSAEDNGRSRHIGRTDHTLAAGWQVAMEQQMAAAHLAGTAGMARHRMGSLWKTARHRPFAVLG